MGNKVHFFSRDFSAVSTAIAGALGVNPNSIYNKLYPEVGDNVKHQLFQQALSKVDKEYEENPNVSSAWLASAIMEAYYTLCEESYGH